MSKLHSVDWIVFNVEGTDNRCQRNYTKYLLKNLRDNTRENWILRWERRSLRDKIALYFVGNIRLDHVSIHSKVKAEMSVRKPWLTYIKSFGVYFIWIMFLQFHTAFASIISWDTLWDCLITNLTKKITECTICIKVANIDSHVHAST